MPAKPHEFFRLAGVLGDVAGTLLADFAASVQQDFQVVRATLDPP